VNPKTGAVTFGVVVSDPGTLHWVLTFPNGAFGVVASKKSSNRARCKKAQVRLRGKCRAARVVFGRGTMSVASAGTAHFTVRPSAPALRALRAALRRGGGLSVTAVVTFDATAATDAVSHSRTLTVRLKKAGKPSSKHKP
jgi:hypothetical protein